MTRDEKIAVLRASEAQAQAADDFDEAIRLQGEIAELEAEAPPPADPNRCPVCHQLAPMEAESDGTRILPHIAPSGDPCRDGPGLWQAGRNIKPSGPGEAPTSVPDARPDITGYLMDCGVIPKGEAPVWCARPDEDWGRFASEMTSEQRTTLTTLIEQMIVWRQERGKATDRQRRAQELWMEAITAQKSASGPAQVSAADFPASAGEDADVDVGAYLDSLGLPDARRWTERDADEWRGAAASTSPEERVEITRRLEALVGRRERRGQEPGEPEAALAIWREVLAEAERFDTAPVEIPTDAIETAREVARAHGWGLEVHHDIGGREEQQDRWRVCSVGDGLLAVVCDGMGGHAGGAQAAQTALDTFVDAVARESERLRADWQAETLLRRAMRAANDALPDHRGAPGTTLTALWVRPGEDCAAVHIGDSSLWVWRGEAWVRCTQHQAVGHRLLACLGGGPSTIDKAETLREDGAAFLLATDGLTTRAPAPLSDYPDETLRATLAATRAELPDLSRADNATGLLLWRLPTAPTEDDDVSESIKAPAPAEVSEAPVIVAPQDSAAEVPHPMSVHDPAWLGLVCPPDGAPSKPIVQLALARAEAELTARQRAMLPRLLGTQDESLAARRELDEPRWEDTGLPVEADAGLLRLAIAIETHRPLIQGEAARSSFVDDFRAKLGILEAGRRLPKRGREASIKRRVESVDEPVTPVESEGQEEAAPADVARWTETCPRCSMPTSVYRVDDEGSGARRAVVMEEHAQGGGDYCRASGLILADGRAVDLKAWRAILRGEEPAKPAPDEEPRAPWADGSESQGETDLEDAGVIMPEVDPGGLTLPPLRELRGEGPTLSEQVLADRGVGVISIAAIAKALGMPGEPTEAAVLEEARRLARGREEPTDDDGVPLWIYRDMILEIESEIRRLGLEVYEDDTTAQQVVTMMRTWSERSQAGEIIELGGNPPRALIEVRGSREQIASLGRSPGLFGAVRVVIG